MLITSPYGALAYAPAHPDHPTNPPPRQPHGRWDVLLREGAVNGEFTTVEAQLLVAGLKRRAQARHRAGRARAGFDCSGRGAPPPVPGYGTGASEMLHIEPHAGLRLALTTHFAVAILHNEVIDYN